MPIPNSFAASFFELQRLSFARSAVAANLSGTALSVIASDAASGSLGVSVYIAPFAGSIVGLTADLSGAVTAGSLTLTPAINGTAVSVTALTPQVVFSGAGQDRYAVTSGQVPGLRFKAGDLLSVQITTNSGYAPTTLDLHVNLYVLFEGVEL